MGFVVQRDSQDAVVLRDHPRTAHRAAAGVCSICSPVKIGRRFANETFGRSDESIRVVGLVPAHPSRRVANLYIRPVTPSTTHRGRCGGSRACSRRCQVGDGAAEEAGGDGGGELGPARSSAADRCPCTFRRCGRDSRSAGRGWVAARAQTIRPGKPSNVAVPLTRATVLRSGMIGLGHGFALRFECRPGDSTPPGLLAVIGLMPWRGPRPRVRARPRLSGIGRRSPSRRC